MGNLTPFHLLIQYDPPHGTFQFDSDATPFHVAIPEGAAADGLYKEGKFAAWNGHQFEAIPGRYQPYTGYGLITLASPRGLPKQVTHPRELAVHVYLPIDTRVRLVDVAGATRAYLNETKTGWLFAHTDEGTHHDYELTLRAACDGIFQPMFRQLQVDEYTAKAEPVAVRAKRRFVVLSAFYGAVLVECQRLARVPHLGEREQSAHPREGWLDRDLTAALAAVRAKWATEQATDLAEIASALRYVSGTLVMPAVETRWAKAARIEAARKAAEEAAKKAAAAQPTDTAGEGE